MHGVPSTNNLDRGKEKGSDGKIKASPTNLLNALRTPHWLDFRFGLDAFKDEIVWAPEHENPPQWRAIDDGVYPKLRIAMDRRGWEAQYQEHALRQTLYLAASLNPMDTAIEWLTRLKWDGVERVETMLHDTMPDVVDRPYTRALSRYIWTTLAGRVLEPGVKADMMPVLVSDEGMRKSTWAAELCPNEDAFSKISLELDDNALGRRMRGKLVVEVEELRGLATKDAEHIKAVISRQKEEWTPKYKEFDTKFLRRCLLIGTTNNDEFITARMGKARRILPLRVTNNLDIDRLVRDREQLWAEAAVMFLIGGVDWSVEKFADLERDKFREDADPWLVPTAQWIIRPDPVTGLAPMDAPFTWGTVDAIRGIGEKLDGRNDRRDQSRMGAILSRLGCEQRKQRVTGLRVYTAAGSQAAEFASSEGEGSAL